jgi:TolB-like protein
MTSKRKLAAIMFADIVGYSAIMQENENKAKQLRDKSRQVIEEQVAVYAGEIIQYYGDGALIIFPSAKQSLMAAIVIQQTLQQEPVVPVRIGVHLGEIVHDHEGVFGDGVNIAARIESLAIAGSILFSDRVCQEITNHPNIKPISLGQFELKNINVPLQLFAIQEEGITIPKVSQLNVAKGRNISRSIAIMPFSNMAVPDEPDYFADGVSEEIINGLSKVEGIDVISRSTCHSILRSGEVPIEVGRRLKVSYFLEGSVRKIGNRVRVSVHLINTDDGYQQWAESYDHDLDNIFQVQDEIAHKVINSLKVNFEIPSQQKSVIEKATANIDAYTQHLKGIHYLKKGNPEEAKKAIEHFEQALAMDPDFTAAECALSRSYSYLGSCGALPPVSAYAKALKCVMSAIEKNRDFAEGHLAMANIKFFHFWDWDGARESLEKAVSLGLNSAELYQSFGLYYAAIGKPSQGILKMIKALELDPLSVQVMTMLGTLYLFNQEYQKAISTFDEILELEPGFRGALQYKGVALACLGRFDEALATFETYHQKVNHPQKALIGLIFCHHHFGHQEKVKELMNRLHTRLKEDYSTAVEVDLAIANAGIGDYDAALGFLESVYEKRLSIACMGMIWVMRCPYFMSLWSHPGYQNLLRKMGMS